MTLRRGRGLFVLFLGLAAVPAGAVTRLGPDLTPTQDGLGYGCQEGLTGHCTLVSLHSTSASVTVAAPFRGVITRWRFRASCCIPDQTVPRALTLRVFKPGPSDGNFGYLWPQPVRSGPAFVVEAGGRIESGNVMELPSRMRIEQGERAGIDVDWPIGLASYASPGVSMVFVQPATADGQEGYGYPIGAALAVNVDVEPDADGDGFGDETQDCHADDPTKSGDCPTTPPPVTPPPVYIPCPPAGCGSGNAGGATFPGPVPQEVRTDGKLVVRVACASDRTLVCGGLLVLEPGTSQSAATDPPVAAALAPGILGQAKYKVRPGRTKKVKLQLTRAARKMLKQTGSLAVKLTLRSGEDSVSADTTLTRQR